MEQFSLEKWLQDKSRKVVTRDGREVDIYYSPTSRIPLIGATTSDNEIHQYTKDGFQCDTFNQAKNDLFFADEEEELTEFEKAMQEYYFPELDDFELKRFAKGILDLARNEILKDLPKWKKATEDKKFDKYVCVMDYYMHPFLDTVVNRGNCYIKLSDLKTLPKEE